MSKEYQTFSKLDEPIDLSKEIKYFKILFEVDDKYRSNLIKVIEAINTGYLNFIYALIKSHILMSTGEKTESPNKNSKELNPKKEISEREQEIDMKEWSSILL